MKKCAFPQSQRLKSQKAIDRLFGNKEYKGRRQAVISSLCYPLCVRAMENQERVDGCSEPKILVSVPKKKIRKAVGRVLIRRRVREAWRQIPDRMEIGAVDIAFIYVADEIANYNKIKHSVEVLVGKLKSSGNGNSNND